MKILRAVITAAIVAALHVPALAQTTPPVGNPQPGTTQNQSDSELRERALAAAAKLAAQFADRIQSIGLPAGFLDSRIIFLSASGSHRFLLVKELLGIILSAPDAKVIGFEKWDQPGVEGIEIKFKFGDNPSFGIVFKWEGDDSYITHLVRDDIAHPLTPDEAVNLCGRLVGSLEAVVAIISDPQ